jgi:hypothetical protein
MERSEFKTFSNVLATKCFAYYILKLRKPCSQDKKHFTVLQYSLEKNNQFVVFTKRTCDITSFRAKQKFLCYRLVIF